MKVHIESWKIDNVKINIGGKNMKTKIDIKACQSIEIEYKNGNISIFYIKDIDMVMYSQTRLCGLIRIKEDLNLLPHTTEDVSIEMMVTIVDEGREVDRIIKIYKANLTKDKKSTYRKFNIEENDDYNLFIILNMDEEGRILTIYK